MRHTTLAAVVILVAAGQVRAESLSLVGVPTGYVPGTPFTFEVHSPVVNGLAEYTIDFVVTAGSPPTLPDLTVSVAAPTGLVGYPFPDDSNLARSFPFGVENPLTVEFTDATSGAAVNVVTGVNDHLATVTISPGVNLSGPITIQFTNAEFTASRDLFVDVPPAFTISQLSTPVDPAAVPAPAGWVLLGTGGLGLAAVRRRRGGPVTA